MKPVRLGPQEKSALQRLAPGQWATVKPSAPLSRLERLRLVEFYGTANGTAFVTVRPTADGSILLAKYALGV